MATFVLQEHANPETLKTLLKSFQERLDQRAKAERANLSNSGGNPTVLLNWMNDALESVESRSQCLIYWPLVEDEYHTKTCVYDTRYEHIKESHQGFHLVYVTNLLARLHPKKSQFLRCHCHNHAHPIPLDWREFIYPQFVELLLKYHSRPSSPSTVLRDLASAPIPTRASTLVTRLSQESLKFTIEMHRGSAFLTHIESALFTKDARDLYREYKNRHLVMFGRENVEQQARHFKRRSVDLECYKLLLKLRDFKMRATGIAAGSSAELRAIVDQSGSGEPWVILASDFAMHVPAKGDFKRYVLFVSKSSGPAKCEFEKRRITTSELRLKKGELCLIVSYAPLRLEFKEGGALYLVTPGACKLDLRGATSLELWSQEKENVFPLRYEINDDHCHSYYNKSKKLGQYYAELHGRYHDVMYNPPKELCNQELIPPVHGYARFYTEERLVVELSTINEPHWVCDIHHYVEPLNQYGSMSDESERKNARLYPELAGLRLYFRHNEGMPCFMTRDDKELVLSKEHYRRGQQHYVLYGLCYAKGEKPWCHFFLNHDRNYILFIPVDFQSR